MSFKTGEILGDYRAAARKGRKGMERKIDRARELMERQQDIFKCPLCGEEMKIREDRALACARGHSFDLARQGYVNFLLGSFQTKYDREMLEARRRVFVGGLFDPLIKVIPEIIMEKTPSTLTGIRLLDAGCGEGSLLARVQEGLSKRALFPSRGVGIDISREGIRLAARDYGGLIWCVGDLARTPFQEGKFHIIINMLSPSNYREFGRITSPGGLLVKVLPGKNHLKELREALYKPGKKEGPLETGAFKDSYKILERFSLTWEKNLSPRGTIRLLDLVRMTPLSWGAGEEKIQELYREGIDRIRLDLELVLGKKEK